MTDHKGQGGAVVANRSGDRCFRGIGQSSVVCADQIPAESFDQRTRAGANSRERGPCYGAPPFGPHRVQIYGSVGQVGKEGEGCCPPVGQT